MTFGSKTPTTSAIRAKKSLGQNFCKDGRVTDEIVKHLAPNRDSCVWEIGPGQGALTSKLAAFGCELTLFEIDARLKPLLEQSFNSAKIIWGDFLKLPVFTLPRPRGNLLVCGNLPYYCATPIIKRFLEEGPRAERLVFLLQNEVAQKAAAAADSSAYGYLSVHTAFFAKAFCGAVFGPESFVPKPKVNSAVLVIEPLKLTDCEIKQRLNALKYVSFLFNQRRKQALPLLKRQWPNIEWAKKFDELEICDKARPQNISADKLLTLFSLSG